MRPRTRPTWVVILAGGEGRGLSGLAIGANGSAIPKQFCALNGGTSLMQLALRRALAVTAQERIVCVVNEAHRRWWEPQFRGLRNTVLVQPDNRGSGLELLLSLLVIAKTDPHGGVLCLPADHYVEQEDLLAESLRQVTVQEVYDSGKITLLGVPPQAPDASFGYLLPGADSGLGMRSVSRFVERPDEANASELMRAGALWNSGIFSAGAARLVELFPRRVPGMMLDLKSIVEYWHDTRHPSAELSSLYARHPRLDFSSDVLENAQDNLQMLPIPPCGWTDVGTPTRLARILWALKGRHSRDTAGIAEPTLNPSAVE